MIRHVLYQAALTASNVEPTFREQKERMADRHKPHKQTTIAILRRMLGVLTAMVRDDVPRQDSRIGAFALTRDMVTTGHDVHCGCLSECRCAGFRPDHDDAPE